MFPFKACLLLQISKLSLLISKLVDLISGLRGCIFCKSFVQHIISHGEGGPYTEVKCTYRRKSQM